MRFRPVFAWFDWWVGAFWDRHSRRLFVMLLPCVGFVLDFGWELRDRIPRKPGWYWWQVDERSPPNMTRIPFAMCILVSEDLQVRFPQGTFHVRAMGGRWVGPIPTPSFKD